MMMRDSLKSIAKEIDRLIAVDDFPSRVKPVFLANAVRDYPSRGGKRLRPALAFWCSRLLGGRDEAVLYPAAAVEVYHNWTLVHDDIIDQDAFRRNVPTSHYSIAGMMKKAYSLSDAEAARQGRDFAMLCGDVQQAWANDLLLRTEDYGVAPTVVLAMSRRMQHLGNRLLVSGEALDMELALREIESISPEEVLEMIRLKTGALLKLAAELGGMTALNSADCQRIELKRIGAFAMAAGVAFQLRDDWLGIFGDEVKLGKAVGGDLREAKPTVLLLTALQMSKDHARKELLGFLKRDNYDQADLDRVRELMTDCGAAKTVNGQAEALADEARDVLLSFGDSDTRQILLEFVDYLIVREK